MPVPPTVTYTWMTYDEQAGHSWITKEKYFRFDDAKNDREKLHDERLVQKFHNDCRAILKDNADKKAPPHYCGYLLKTKYTPKQVKVSVIATARLYRRKGERIDERGRTEEAQVHQLAPAYDIGVQGDAGRMGEGTQDIGEQK